MLCIIHWLKVKIGNHHMNTTLVFCIEVNMVRELCGRLKEFRFPQFFKGLNKNLMQSWESNYTILLRL